LLRYLVEVAPAATNNNKNNKTLLLLLFLSVQSALSLLLVSLFASSPVVGIPSKESDEEENGVSLVRYDRCCCYCSVATVAAAAAATLVSYSSIAIVPIAFAVASLIIFQYQRRPRLFQFLCLWLSHLQIHLALAHVFCIVA
jgi:hypothetical protein